MQQSTLVFYIQRNLRIKNVYLKCMHIGSELVRHYLQQSFRILSLRKALRHIHHPCFLCRRFHGKGLHTFMAVYLQSASKTSKLIHILSRTLDFTTSVRSTLLKKVPQKKNYICIDTCLTTRTIHLNITENLTNEKKLTRVCRFMVRRGSPKLFFLRITQHTLSPRLKKSPMNT